MTSSTSTSTSLQLLVLIAVLSSAIFFLHALQSIIQSPALEEHSHCYSAPYLYVTVHDTSKNILKYSRNGCLLSDDVLDDHGFSSDIRLLRSMLIGSYSDEKYGKISDALYVTDSYIDSQLLVFGSCYSDSSNKKHRDVVKRPLLKIISDTNGNPGLSHPYGLCFDNDDNIYVSCQHTDCILRFYKDTYEPMPLPPAFYRLRRDDYYAGTFLQFGEPKEHPINEQGIRGICRVRSNILVANEDLNGIGVVSINTGLISDIIPIDKPIGVLYDEQSDIIYVGSKSFKYGGKVFALDGKTYEVLKEFSHPKMTHPSGLVVYDSILYVGEQNTGSILTFDVFTCKYIETVVHNMPGLVEQIILSEC